MLHLRHIITRCSKKGKKTSKTNIKHLKTRQTHKNKTKHNIYIFTHKFGDYTTKYNKNNEKVQQNRPINNVYFAPNSLALWYLFSVIVSVQLTSLKHIFPPGIWINLIEKHDRLNKNNMNNMNFIKTINFQTNAFIFYFFEQFQIKWNKFINSLKKFNKFIFTLKLNQFI